ncbi:MAG TPA: DUF1345 domain-containing protein [Candidatus Dormibacteraeota bacterium]|nr:DUF1345 domain-containing protein [Candidatus Dormibacteraeota bacterium]
MPDARAHTTSRDRGLGPSARTRLLTSVAVAVAVGIVLGVLVRPWELGLLSGWMAGAAVFVAWMWLTIWPMDSNATRRHAVREDAGRAGIDAAITVASVASLAAVALLLLAGSSAGAGRDVHIAVCVGTVAVAWGTVHTLFTTRYARLYYGAGPGIDFNQEKAPRYSDFAYLAFTIGMTYQVSDTDLKTSRIRATALGQGLLSYVFGVFIIAFTINLVASLSQ